MIQSHAAHTAAMTDEHLSRTPGEKCFLYKFTEQLTGIQ